MTATQFAPHHNGAVYQPDGLFLAGTDRSYHGNLQRFPMVIVRTRIPQPAPLHIETNVNRTGILLALLVLVGLLQLFPDKSALIKLVWVSGGALYALVWAGAKYLAKHKLKSAEAVQRTADDEEYRQYKMELDVIRTKHDPHRDLNEPTSISPE